MSAHVCRCTGYQMILEAVIAATRTGGSKKESSGDER